MSEAPAEPQALVETEAIVRRLGSRYVGERMDARRALDALGEEAVPRLVALIRRENAKRVTRRRIYFGIVGAVTAAVLPVTWFVAVQAAHGNPGILGALGGVYGGGYGGFGGGFAWLLNPTATQYAALRALAEVQDRRAVGALALALNIGDQTPQRLLRNSAAEALIRLLPQLGPDDGDLLDREQRRGLYRALARAHRDKEAEFIVVIADALARIGDVAALLTVQEVAAIPARTPNERTVVEAARAAADQLDALRRKQEVAVTLLRPSSDPLAPSESLLRAASTSVAEPDAATVLLRPTSNTADQQD